MSGHTPWREVKAEKQRRDRERGREPIRAHQHEPDEPCDETCHELADRFIYTRGPHEGQPIVDPDHICVPECYEDQSAALERATHVDPRPRYRVIAEPWYDHDAGTDGHDALACAAGYALEVYRCNPDVRGTDHWQLIGATQTDSGGTFDLREVNETVIDYVRTLAHPHPSNPDPDRIEVYHKVTP